MAPGVVRTPDPRAACEGPRRHRGSGSGRPGGPQGRAGCHPPDRAQRPAGTWAQCGTQDLPRGSLCRTPAPTQGPQDSPRDPVDPRTPTGTPQTPGPTQGPPNPTHRPSSPQDHSGTPNQAPGTPQTPAPTQGLPGSQRPPRDPPSPRNPDQPPRVPPTMCSVSAPTAPPGRMPRGPCSNTAPSGVRVLCSHPPRRALASSSNTWGQRGHRGDSGGPGVLPNSRTLPALTLGGLGPRAKW